jgi:hypothetical protein
MIAREFCAVGSEETYPGGKEGAESVSDGGEVGVKESGSHSVFGAATEAIATGKVSESVNVNVNGSVGVTRESVDGLLEKASDGVPGFCFVVLQRDRAPCNPCSVCPDPWLEVAEAASSPSSSDLPAPSPSWPYLPLVSSNVPSPAFPPPTCSFEPPFLPSPQPSSALFLLSLPTA